MAYERVKRIFDPGSTEPFTVSRSKLDLFFDCPRCFYMDCRLGIGRPSFPPFTLNNAVDSLLKNEFDLLRKKGESHVLMQQYGIDAVPFNHPDLPKWRGEVAGYFYVGASYLHEGTNFKLTGMVDDLWQNSAGEIIVVDYKATSTIKEISLDDQWKQGYKRQIEFYQWLFRRLGFTVSDTGYFVFANAKKDRDSFDGRLEFAMSILTYKGDDSWVEGRIEAAHACLLSDEMPKEAPACEYCTYRKSSAIAAAKILKKI